MFWRPNTRLGSWSVGLAVACILLIGLVNILINSGQEGGDTFFSNLYLSLPVLIGASAGISAFFTGIVAIVKRKERAVFVFLSTAIGLFVLWFVLGEIFIPH